MQFDVQDKDSQKRMIGEHLRAADKFIKTTEYPKALEEVNKALAIEPKNMYALAYNERIKVALEAARKKEEEDKAKGITEEKKATASAKPAETGARAANIPDAKPQPSPTQPAPPAAQIPGDDLIAKIKKEAQEAADKRADGRIEQLKQEFTATQQKLQQDVAQLAAQAKEAATSKDSVEKKYKAEIEQLKESHHKELESQKEEQKKQVEALKAESKPSPERAKAEGISLLLLLFQEAWKDGTISNDERVLLSSLKSKFELSDQEFSKIEIESKTGSYVLVLQEVWKDGQVTPEEAEQLEHMRKSLSISAEEHFRLEAQVRKEYQAKK
jgi:hypothetical protein